MSAEIAPTVERRFADEAFGSPQLMQSICLNLCYVLGLSSPLNTQERLSVTSEQINETLLRMLSFSDFSKMVTALHTGPRVRGTERKVHNFIDNTSGDVYRSILLAIKKDPLKLSFGYQDIIDRVRSVCIGDSPVGSSVTSALEQMSVIAEEIRPKPTPKPSQNRFLSRTPFFISFFQLSPTLGTLT